MMTQRDYEVEYDFDRVVVMGKIFLLAILLPILFSCTQAPPRGEGSVIILAISNLRADDLPCESSADSLTPQFDQICKESARFTHAYTPSVLGIPAMASVLTGLYPAEHGVHDNGPSRYLSEVVSLPQIAKLQGLETFFVSGGVPALRKTAISKGFTVFDDSIRSNGSFYRKATDTVLKFINLLETRSEESSFLGVVQLVDLAFPEDVSFKTNREGGASGKLQEIDEALGLLRSYMVKNRIWDPANVIILGLQGNEGVEHSGLSKGLSLYDEVVHVPLLMKPPRKPRDQGLSWKVDEPVSLVDLGASLKRTMGVPSSSTNIFKIVDSLPQIRARAPDQPERPLFSESDLPAWRGWGPRLISIRQGEWFYWAPPEPKLFNTYTDHLELHNLFDLDINSTFRLKRTAMEFMGTLRDNNLSEQRRGMAISVGEKLRTAKVLFSKTGSFDEKLRSLTEIGMRRPHDWQIVQWHVSLLFENQDWVGLHQYVSQKKLITTEDERSAQDQSLWATAAGVKLHLPRGAEEFNKDPLVGCLFYSTALRRFNLGELEALVNHSYCKDPETQAWMSAFVYQKLKRFKEANAFFDLAHLLTDRRMDQTEFAKAFWFDGATWDYNLGLPEGPAVFPLVLALVNSSEFLEFTKKKQLP